ncbi:hypothetical protein [Flavobacterium sp.]|uniref:hypothetical protein n=1 Tax=Flavobacterium sp. TaxID=239 RepID=UPI004047DFC9
MSKLNKEFEYKGYKFNTSVELNTRAERKINGKVWHTIITNCMDGNNYYQKEEIETFQIEEVVEKHKQNAIDYIDKLTFKEKSFEEMLLSSLGFQ